MVKIKYWIDTAHTEKTSLKSQIILQTNGDF